MKITLSKQSHGGTVALRGADLSPLECEHSPAAQEVSYASNRLTLKRNEFRAPSELQSRGSALVAALIMSAVIGIVVCSFLVLIADRNYITQRSLAWNTGIPVLEAGIEEAFTHLHNDGSLTANGWMLGGTNATVVYTKTRNFTNNSTYCMMTISNVSANGADIYSQGFVPSPTGSGYISRTVQVRTTNSAIFTKAISAKGIIQFSGGSMVDSFNSSNPLYSTNGMYIASKHEANGGVVTDSSANPAISISSGKIDGKTATGPLGTVTTSGSGAIGDLAWTTGIEPGYTNNTMNVTYQDQSAPPGSALWLLPPNGVVGTTNCQYVLGNNSYKLSSLTISQSGSGQPVIVTGNATLYITGDLTVQGSGYIYIMPGASLNLYVGGSTTTLSGSGVENGAGNAANFSYHGLPTNTSITYSGSSGFFGTLDAPEANFTLSGSAAFVGAAIVNTFNDSGGAAVHYDEALGGNGGLKLISYKEL